MQKLLKKLNLKSEESLFILILIFFTAVTLYLAFKLKLGVSPDSYYHIDVSRIFSRTLGIPLNSSESWKWRDIENIPYLYYWINGRLLNINFLHINEVVLLRIVNVIYSIGTVWGAYLIAKELLKNKWARLLPVFLLTNSLMFVFLSAAINYDNLANLFATFATLFFIKSTKKKDIQNAILFLIFLLLGVLTKYTLAPLAFILTILLAYDWIKNKDEVSLKINKNTAVALAIPFAILVGLNAMLYGKNLVKFHSLVPECNQVLTHEQCLENGVYNRDVNMFPPIVIEGFKGISELITSGKRIGPIRYTFFWIYDMSRKVVGIMGDSTLMMPNQYIWTYLLALLIGIILTIKHWKTSDIKIKYLTISTLFYLSIILITQNYKRYLYQGLPSLALQGRYSFPVLISFYVILIYFLYQMKNEKLRNAFAIILTIIYFLGCLPLFFSTVPSWWFEINF